MDFFLPPRGMRRCLCAGWLARGRRGGVLVLARRGGCPFGGDGYGDTYEYEDEYEYEYEYEDGDSPCVRRLLVRVQGALWPPEVTPSGSSGWVDR